MPAKEKSKQEKSTAPNGSAAFAKFLRYFSIFLIIIFTSSALVTLTFRQRFLSPNLYTNALNASGLYSLTADVIEDKATDALLTLEKELVVRLGLIETDAEERTVIDTILISVVSSVLENATEQLVASLSEKIDLEGLVQETVEEVIVNDLAWLRGEREDPKVFQMIPPPEQIEEFRDVRLSDLITGFTSDLFGISALPICTNEEEAAQNLAIVREGGLFELTCTSDELAPLIQAAVSEFVPKEDVSELEAGVKRDLDRFQIKPVFDELIEISSTISNFKEAAIQLRGLVKTSLETAYFMLFVSIPLLFYALFVSKGKRVQTFFKIYLGVGLIILSFSIVYYLGVSNAAVNFFPGSPFKIVEGLLTSTQQVLFVQGIRVFKLSIIRDLSLSVFLVGLFISTVAAVPLAILKVLERTQSKVDLELEEEDFS